MPAYSAAGWRAALAAACALLMLVPAAGCSKADDRPRSQASGPPKSAGPAEPEAPDDHAEDTMVVPALPKAVDVVTRFAALWVREDLPKQAWWDAIAPLCERGFALELFKTGPPKGQQLKVTGKPTLKQGPAVLPGTVVTAGDPSGIDLVYHVPVTGAVLVVNLAVIQGAWVVSSVDFKRVIT